MTDFFFAPCEQSSKYKNMLSSSIICDFVLQNSDMNKFFHLVVKFSVNNTNIYF